LITEVSPLDQDGGLRPWFSLPTVIYRDESWLLDPGSTQPLEPSIDEPPTIRTEIRDELNFALSDAPNALPINTPPATEGMLATMAASTWSSTRAPWSDHLEMGGQLDSEHDSMTYTLPIGPATRTVGISVRPMAEAGSDGPVIDSIILFDANGKKLSEMAAEWDEAHPAPQYVLVTLSNVPSGAHLAFRVSAPAGGFAPAFNDSTLISPPSDASEASPWAIPFMVDVQWQETTPTSPQNEKFSGAADSAEPSTVTFDTVATTHSPSSSSPSSSAARKGGSDDGDLDSASEPIGVVPTTVEPRATTTVRVPTGPLANRSAAPMGGLLASSADDLDGDPDANGNESNRRAPDALADFESDWCPNHEPADATGTDAGEDEQVVVAERGAGGVPLLGPGMIGDDLGTGSSKLLASLAGVPTADSAPSELGIPDVSPPSVPVEATSEPWTPKSNRPAGSTLQTLISAAFGLSLGLTLTSGPLFPDLLAMARTARRPRWFRRRKPSSTV
jgi:hypothetical protein